MLVHSETSLLLLRHLNNLDLEISIFLNRLLKIFMRGISSGAEM